MKTITVTAHLSINRHCRSPAFWGQALFAVEKCAIIHICYKNTGGFRPRAIFRPTSAPSAPAIPEIPGLLVAAAASGGHPHPALLRQPGRRHRAFMMTQMVRAMKPLYTSLNRHGRHPREDRIPCWGKGVSRGAPEPWATLVYHHESKRRRAESPPVKDCTVSADTAALIDLCRFVSSKNTRPRVPPLAPKLQCGLYP